MQTVITNGHTDTDASPMDELRALLPALRPWQRVPTGAMLEEAWCRITPEVAERIIANHMKEKNRTLNVRQVTTIMNDLIEGRYLYLGDPIVFDRRGNLIDGQHRVYGCFRSGVTIDCARVIVGMPTEVIKVLDVTRRTRTGAEALGLAFDIEISKSLWSALLTESHKTFDRNVYKMPKSRQMELVAAYPLTEDLKLIERAARNGIGSPSGALAAAARCLRADRFAAVKFWTAVFGNEHEIDGVKSETVRTLINALIAVRNEKGASEATTERCIRAWNAWRNGVEMKLLRASGNIPEVV